MSTTLPFTLLEEMTHHLDETFQPWNMQGELESSATIDVERLAAAAETAAGVHPLARARRRPSSLADTQYSWEILDEPDPVEVRVVDGSEVDLQTVRNRLYGRRFHLTEEPPFELVVYRGGGIDGGDVLLLSVSHVAADGVGALRFGQSIWTAYRGEEPVVDPVSLEASRSLIEDIQLSGIADRVEAVGSASLQFEKFLDSPTRIARDGGSDREGWGYARRYLDADLTGRLVGGRPEGISVNDVLLAALHLAIDAWNDDHGRRSRRISVMMPMNLRPPEWFYQVMAMYTMFESVTTRRFHRKDPQETLAEVAEQTTKIKQQDRPVALYKALQLLPPGTPVALKRQLPELLNWPGDRLVDTSVLTNLGNIPVAPSLGDDSEERVWFSMPAWESTPVGFAVGTLEGELNLFCRYLLRQFDERAAERFVDGYVDQITRLVDEELPAMTAD